MGLLGYARRRSRSAAIARALAQRVEQARALRGPDHVQEAVTELREVLRVCLSESLIGPDHEVTYRTRSRLAAALFAAGEHAQARSEAESVLAAWLPPGPLRDRVRREARGALALAMNAQGHHAEAAGHFAVVVKEYRVAVGSRHPVTMDARLHHARSLVLTEGREAEAEAECRKVLRQCDRQDAVTRMVAGAAANALATTLLFQGRHAEAEEPARRAVELGRELAGDPAGERLVHGSQVTLAYALSGQGRHQEAMVLLDSLRPSGEAASGRTATTDMAALDNVRARALLGLERYDEAEVAVRRALDELSRVLGPGHRRITRARALLADITAARTNGNPGHGDSKRSSP